MKRHSSICQRYEPSHEKTCSTWYWLQHYEELRQNMEVICINTKNVGLLPWVVCESGMTCYVDGGSSTLSSTQLFRWWIVNWWSQFFCFGARRWWKSSYRRQGYDSQRDVRWLNTVHRRFFCYQMNIFIKTVLLLAEQDVIASAIAAGTFSSSIHHLSKLQPDRQRLIISSSVLMNSSTSQLQLKFCVLCRDWQHYCVNSDILYGIVSTLFSRLEYCITLWLSTLFSRLGYCITLWLTTFLAD